VKTNLDVMLPRKFSFLQDFTASTISTIFCSIVSTPQMVLTDRLMAGVYPSFPEALNRIMKKEGIRGFYTGWWPALAQKIPSYG
jgi:Mitochondrial carrier protein